MLIAGATSAAGHAVASALLGAGTRVIAVGSDRERLDAMGAALPALETELCDLTDENAVLELAMRVHHRIGDIDGVVHLVGGWRGGGGIAGQSEADHRFLERSFTALRHVSRVFYDDLVVSPAGGRLAIVSSTSVARPLAGGASYAAVKAASEAWARAVAHGFSKDSGRAASVIYRVKTLAGREDELAASVAGLWETDAAELNDRVIELS